MSKEIFNLVPAIKAIEKELSKLADEYNRKIQPYFDSLEKLREINQACEYCNGTGHVLRTRSCAEDDRPDPNDINDYIKCRACGGTGLSHNKESDKDWNIH